MFGRIAIRIGDLPLSEWKKDNLLNSMEEWQSERVTLVNGGMIIEMGAELEWVTLVGG